MTKLKRVLLICLSVCLPAFAQAYELPQERAQQARVTYMINCLGCHTMDGRGSPGRVPKVNDFMGHFLKVDGGREFLVQVPGSANAPVGDAALADLLNWMLLTFSPSELPQNFQPYSESEVARLRQSPLMEVEKLRAELVDKITEKTGASEAD